MIPTTNQIKVYSLASKLNPQNTSNTKINVIIGNTGKNGTLNDGTGKSLPSRFLKRYIARDTNINATNVPAEISCAKNANGNIEPINTPIIVRIKSALFGRCLWFNFDNQGGNKPSRPNEYNKRDPANIIPIKAVNIPITEIA